MKSTFIRGFASSFAAVPDDVRQKRMRVSFTKKIVFMAAIVFETNAMHLRPIFSASLEGLPAYCRFDEGTGLDSSLFLFGETRSCAGSWLSVARFCAGVGICSGFDG